MKQFDRCTKCILSASFPGIEFDENGVCNFCRDEFITTTDDKKIEKAKEKINKLLQEQKGESEYDAIMCYSGGKDSTYTLMKAVKKYKLNILSFTLDNGFISPVAFDNINRVIDYLGVDHVTIRPSQVNMKKIFKASSIHAIYNLKSLVRISSPCYSCISIVNNLALKMALEKEIPFILAGFTLGQIPANSIIYQNNYRFLQESREKYLENLRSHVGDVIDEYFCIKDKLLDRVEKYPYNLNLLCLEDISENEILEEISKIGWKPPKDVDGCSSNCKLNTFNNMVHQKTFGYNSYELELSHLIRKEKITREEALEKITNQPDEQIKSVMKDLGITEEDIENLHKIY